MKTTKKILFRFFQRNNSYRYVDDLQSIIKAFNSTFHESIGRAPKDVTEQNRQEVWDYQYVKHSRGYNNNLKKALKRAGKLRKRKNGEIKSPFKYSIGQTV